MSHEDVCWIRTVPPIQATAQLGEVYSAISPRGKVAHILQAESLDPATLAAHYALYRQIMFGPSPLSRIEREMIAVVVSRQNHCEY